MLISVIAITIAMVLLLAMLLFLTVGRLRPARRQQYATARMTSGGERNPRDEDTQPLPASIRQMVRPSATAALHASQCSDKGARPINEDDTLIMPLKDGAGTPRTGLYAIADGMGGHEKGEVASRTATEAVIRALQAEPFFQSGDFLSGEQNDQAVVELLRDAVTTANRDVYALKMEQRTNMGTTIVLALVLRGKAYIANVGDSRAYLLRGGQARQLTEDHSFVERMVASGQITEAEARLHPQRNIVTRSVGTDPSVEVDLFVEPLQPGDKLLLCSDGLSGPLSDAALVHVVEREPDLDAACRALVKAALDSGGTDNISVVLVEVTAS